MAKGKSKNLTNRNQDHSPSSEPSTPTSPSPGHPNTPENLDLDLKAYLMMMVEDIKKDFNNSLKEIQNTAKELQVLKEKQENTIKQVEVLTEKEETGLGPAGPRLRRGGGASRHSGLAIRVRKLCGEKPSPRVPSGTRAAP